MEMPHGRPASLPAGRALLVVVVAALLVVPAVAGTAAARPPPREICAICAELEQRDTLGAAPVVVEESETTIRVDEDGTGHWRSEVVLGQSTATELEGDPERRRSLVAAAFDRRVAVENPRDLRSRLDGRTLVVEYRVPDMAHRSTGSVLLVDFFYGEGDAGVWYRLGADEVSLVGPSGTAVTHAPDAAAVDGNTLTWRAPPDDWALLGGSGFVAFAPDGGPVSQAATVLAVQADIGQASLSDVPVGTPLPAGLLALVVGMLAVRGRWLLDRSAVGRAAAAGGLTVALTLVALLTVAVSGLATGRDAADLVFGWLFATVLSGTPLLLLAVPLLVGAQWMLATGWRPRNDGPDLRNAGEGTTRSLRSLLVGAAVVVAATALLAALAAAASGGSALTGVVAALFFGPVVLFVPLGASERAGHPARHLLRLAVVAAPAALVFAVAPFGGYGQTFLPVFLGPWAVLTGAAGVLAWPLGYRLAEGDASGGDAVGDVEATAGG